MSTWYGYICLSHKPALEADRSFHGHQGEQTLWATLEDWRAKRTIGAQEGTPTATAMGWLLEHPDCQVGVANGYGEWKAAREVEYTKVKPYLLGEPKPADINIQLGGEIRPGGWYVLQTDQRLRPQEAMRCREQLDQRFPGTTFAILDNALKLVSPPEMVFELKGDGAEIGARLRDAVERARGEAKDSWQSEAEPSRKLAAYGALYALELLGRALARPERDGAGALPDPSEPVAASSTPAPSRLCPESPDGLHNWVQMLDGDNQPMGGVHCGYCGVPR